VLWVLVLTVLLLTVLVPALLLAGVLLAGQSVREPGEEPGELGAFPRLPVREDVPERGLAAGPGTGEHVLSSLRHRDDRRAAIARISGPTDQPGRLERGNLPADRGQVETGVPGQHRQALGTLGGKPAEQEIGRPLKPGAGRTDRHPAPEPLRAAEEDTEVTGDLDVFVPRHSTPMLACRTQLYGASRGGKSPHRR